MLAKASWLLYHPTKTNYMTPASFINMYGILIIILNSSSVYSTSPCILRDILIHDSIIIIVTHNIPCIEMGKVHERKHKKLNYIGT